MHLLSSFPLLSLWTILTSSQYHEPSFEQVAFDKPAALPNDGGYFGFRLAYSSQNRRLLASAPFANVTGEVYSCDMESRVCSSILVDWSESKSSVDESTNFLLGSTMVSSSSLFVTCAARHVRPFSSGRYFVGNLGNFGECFFEKNGTLSPLKGFPDKQRISKFHLEKGMDTFGWSSAITREGSVLIGGPGMSVGRVEVYNSPYNLPPKLIEVKKVSFNFGFSIAVGNFFTDNENDTIYAISTTYGEIGRGKVIFFSKNYTQLWNIEEEGTVGTMFGGTLCSAHLDEDGISDLLVAAPALHKPAPPHEPNVGAVTVYLSKERKMNNTLGKFRTIYAFTANSGFGTTLLNIGDLTNDQIDDIAISAPYEDEGRGAVYIYSGASLSGSTEPKYMQKVSSAKRGGWFGLSLAAVESKAGCNDLAIGIPKNNTIALLRCMPSIAIKLYIVVPNLQERRDDYSFFNFEACLNVSYPRNFKKIIALIRVQVNIFHQTAKLAGNDTRTISLQDMKTNYCENFTVLRDPSGDYSKPITYQITAQHLNDSSQSMKFIPELAVLSDSSETEVQGPIWATSDCASESKCEPLLDIDIVSPLGNNSYVVGSTKTASISLNVNNTGDPAYAPIFKIHVDTVNVLMKPPSCEIGDKHDLICTPPKPILRNHNWKTEILLDMTTLTNKNKELNVTTYNILNGVKSHNFFLQHDFTGVKIKGESNRGEIIKMTNDDVYGKGMLFEHIYTIENTGFTPWLGLEATFTLEDMEYIHYSDVKIVDTAQAITKTCKISSFQVKCPLCDLRPNVTLTVYLPIVVKSRSLEQILSSKNITITSEMAVHLNDRDIKTGLSVKLVWEKHEVQLWIIIAAALFGFVILVIIAFALYRCGFFRRKKHEKLRNLRRNIKSSSSTFSKRESNLVEDATVVVDADDNNQHISTSSIIKDQ